MYSSSIEMDGFFTPKHGKGPEIDVLVIAGFYFKLYYSWVNSF
jgi:hypothetical protein